MALPSTLSSLSVREAIIDTLYRCVNGLDTADVALFDSAFTKDANLDLNGNVLNGLDAIRTGCYDLISKLDTTHFLTNIRVDVKDNESKAGVTASALARHYRFQEGKEPGATHFTAGSLYTMECIKDDTDGLWKVMYWKLNVVWSEGDYGIMIGA